MVELRLSEDEKIAGRILKLLPGISMKLGQRFPILSELYMTHFGNNVIRKDYQSIRSAKMCCDRLNSNPDAAEEMRN